MDFKRMTMFFALALLILLGWEHFFPTPKPSEQTAQQQQVVQQKAAQLALTPLTPITVTTDTVKAVIDEKTGDLRQMTLLQYNATEDENKNFVLFFD
ncbi:MAG: membrane protein insertase YidC, partial [Neisseria sp.]|nr:membrane protein insertase YidC [Neisseria sp.]